MIIPRFKSSKEVIENVFRDNGYQREIPWLDLIYWIYEALELIGNTKQYVIKIKGVNNDPAMDITDYKAKLPCDFHKLIWILVDGFPARLQSGGSIHLLAGDCCDDISESVANGETWVDNAGNMFNSALGGVSGAFAPGAKVITYDINNDYITISQQEGKVCMGYYAYALDDEGFPLIPDDLKYKLAVTKYLTKKLDFIEWRNGNLPLEVYRESEMDCNWYMGSASNNVKIPDVAEMEILKNNLLRLKPRNSDYNSMFKYLGHPEGRKFR